MTVLSPKNRRMSQAELATWIAEGGSPDYERVQDTLLPPRLRWDRQPGEGAAVGDAGVRFARGATPRPGPLQSFHAYSNYRPKVDWNTCGQAAIASLADFWKKDPYSLPRTSGAYWDDGQIIDLIKSDGLGPDVIFGWGTTPWRIRDALRKYGVDVEVGSSGFLFSEWESERDRLLRYVDDSALPVAALVDLGLLGGPAWTAHWTIVWRVDRDQGEPLLHLGNWGWMPSPVPISRFLEAWSCRMLPVGFNHAAIYCGTPLSQP